MVGYIYKWENKINGKVYIGQTMNRYGYKKRWKQHIYDALNKNNNNHFHNAIKKYGHDRFNKTVLETIKMDNRDELKSYLDKLEIKYIYKYDSFNNGYNSTLGGDFNVWNSGDYNQIKKAKEDSLISKAINSINKSIYFNKLYKLPESYEDLVLKYTEFDICDHKYKYRYISKGYLKQKPHDHPYYGLSLEGVDLFYSRGYGRQIKIYSLESMDDYYEEYVNKCVHQFEYDLIDNISEYEVDELKEASLDISDKEFKLFIDNMIEMIC